MPIGKNDISGPNGQKEKDENGGSRLFCAVAAICFYPATCKYNRRLYLLRQKR